MSPVAVPLPKPVLITTPRVPLLPPLPLPYPPPDGRSKDPRAAILTAFPGVPLAGIPFGSPKPPVWTCEAGRATLGVAELPVEKTLVATILGTTGAGLLGSGSSLRG